jgi:hypothetical protein
LDLIVKADSPFKDVKDLNGKKVGISTKASTSDGGAVDRQRHRSSRFRSGPGFRPASGQVDAIVFSALTTLRGSCRPCALLVDVGRTCRRPWQRLRRRTRDDGEASGRAARATLAILERSPT